MTSLAAKLPTTKGNSTLTGYFAVHSPIIRDGTARCGPINVQDGVLLLEAFRYAINVTNHMGILPKGFTLGYQLFDTCKSTVELKKHISPTLFSEDEKLTGVVGPYTSSEAVLAASVFSVFKTTEISYKASSLELEDRGRYNNFFRTVPSDRFEAKAILDIMKHFKWLYVSCISSHERQQGVFVLKSLIENDRRCIAKQVSLPEIPKTATYQDAIDSVSVDEKAKVVILFTTREDTIGLLSAAKKKGYGKGVVWIGGTGWGNLLMQSDLKGIGDGAISLNYPSHQHDSGFRKYFCSLNPKRNTYGYFKEFWQAVFDCTYDSSKDYDKKLCTNREKIREGKEFPRFTTIGPVMDAVYVYAQTLTNSLQKTCGEKITIACVKSNYYSSILHWIKLSLSTDVFKSLNKNDNISFDAVGGVKGKFDLLNLIWKNGVYAYEKIGSWQAGTGREGMLDMSTRIHWPEGVKGPVLSRCSEPCKPEIGEVKKPTLSIKGKHCCWDCHQCKPNDIVSVNETCVTCGNDYEPDKTRSNCNKLTEVSVSFNHPVGIVAIALSALGILLTTFVIGLFIYHNTAPIVKASGRELSYFMLIAIYICFAAAIVFLCPPTKTICGIQRFIAGLSLNLCYASLLLKTNRLYRIFKHATLSVAKPSLTSPLSQVIIALAITSIQVLLGVVWSIGDPPKVYRHYPTDKNYVMLYCKTDAYIMELNLCVCLVLMLACTWFAFKTRNFPKNFNESKSTMLTMYASCFVWGVFLPIFILSDNKNEYSQTYTIVLFCDIIAYVTLAGLFGPKVRIIFWPGMVTDASQVGAVSRADGLELKKNTLMTRATISSYPAVVTKFVDGVDAPLTYEMHDGRDRATSTTDLHL